MRTKWSRLGVVVEAPGVRLRCAICDQTWQPRRGPTKRRLSHGFWRCPNGCNAIIDRKSVTTAEHATLDSVVPFTERLRGSIWARMLRGDCGGLTELARTLKLRREEREAIARLAEKTRDAHEPERVTLLEIARAWVTTGREEQLLGN